MKQINCRQAKELISAETDKMLDNASKEALNSHISGCAECAQHMESYKLMTSAVRSISFIEPEYLESKINAAVAGSMAKQPLFAKNPLMIPAFGISFVAVFAFSFFLIYNKQAPQNIQTAAVKAPAQVAMASVVKTQPNTAVKAEPKQEIASAKPNGFVRVVAPVYENTQVRMPVKEQPAQAPVIASAPQAENKPVYSIAKDEITPTPGSTILDKERAVVANNLINPNKGMSAKIRFKVDETCRVKVVIYDKSVRVVAVLLDEEKQPGTFEVPWYGKTDGNVVCRDGAYFVTIQIGRQVIKRNVMVSKNF